MEQVVETPLTPLWMDIYRHSLNHSRFGHLLHRNGLHYEKQSVIPQLVVPTMQAQESDLVAGKDSDRLVTLSSKMLG